LRAWHTEGRLFYKMTNYLWRVVSQRVASTFRARGAVDLVTPGSPSP
jgi:hypothetical protein